MVKGILAISLAVLLCWPANCAAQTGDPGPVRVGDRWSYDIKDDLTGDLRQAITIVVVDVNDKEITTRDHISGQRSPANYGLRSRLGANRRRCLEVSPSGIGIRKPLQVGKEWRSDGNAMHLQSGILFVRPGWQS